MEIEVDVYSENAITGDRSFTTTCFLTYVAINQDGKAIEVPQLKLETDEERERFKQGEQRSQQRLKALEEVKSRVNPQI
jgi:acyl-CoA hydrolase